MGSQAVLYTVSCCLYRLSHLYPVIQPQLIAANFPELVLDTIDIICIIPFLLGISV